MFVIKTSVLSIIEWPLIETGFTVWYIFSYVVHSKLSENLG